VLGCLLFLTYINDLPSVIPHKVVLFADDATVIISCNHGNLGTLNSILTESLTKIVNHLKDIGLILNADKTKVMQFRPYQRSELSFRLLHDGQKIEEVSSFTLLGITMDTTLTWKNHIATVVNKLSQFSYALRELRKSTNAECALIAYHSHAGAWIRYGVALWGNATNIENVLILQKRCLRIYNTHHTETIM
jgi:hypothetical protein